MTRYLLDTDVCVDLLRGRRTELFQRLRDLPVDEVGMSSITFAELQYGVAKSARPGHHAMLLVRFCAPLAILPFDGRAGESYGQVRALLEAQGTPIGPLDTLIAAHALCLGATLLTSNRREFSRVPGLQLAEPDPAD